MNILQISTYDRIGGAAQIAWNLAVEYRRLGHRALLAVGHPSVSGTGVVEPEVLEIDRHTPRGPWSAAWLALYRRLDQARGRIKGAGRLADTALYLSEADRRREFRRGRESFEYPASHRVLELVPSPADIVHGHNLHGEYFDLRALSPLSRKVPTVLTLHDQWLFTGHCAYSIDCTRWQSGCGQCPDLARYPAIAIDRTAQNWRRKQELLREARLFVATPSRWLLAQVDRSLLRSATVAKRCIPNGVDRDIFRPAETQAVRRELDIDENCDVLLFVAQAGGFNPYKDLATVREAVERLAARPRSRRLVLLALGEDGGRTQLGEAELRRVPFERDARRVAKYYQACDLYLHGALTDNFPQVILEAFACGKPVIASAVGGIPEQVRDWRASSDGNGALVPPRNPEAMAAATAALLDDADLRRRLAARAAEDARASYDVRLQAKRYLEWYAEILRRDEPSARATTRPAPATPR